MTGRVAVVTGASGMLGIKHCEALAETGAQVVGLDLDATAATALAERLTQEYGSKCLGLACDITSPEQVEQALTATLATFGRVDALINNARWMYKPEELLVFEQFKIETLQNDFRVQVEGALLCSQKFGAQMAKQGKGSIVNICSTYGLVAPDLRIYADEPIKVGAPVSYSITKSALVGFTKYLAAYWGPAGVRVNLLTPGGIRAEGRRQSDTFLQAYSQRVPMGRMAAPHEMQGAVVFLCSDASSYMTGTNLVVDGGWTAW
jgi:NAD(P)-dependent dehydrogenase (short-subunit alcohol dehydrogenase family)